MNTRLRDLADRIRSELPELELVIGRIEDAWQRNIKSTDDYYLDSVALNLHGFYSGLERIFEIIATNIDAKKPSGENWHQQLLHQMAEEIPSVRPAVISTIVCTNLTDYRGFGISFAMSTLSNLIQTKWKNSSYKSPNCFQIFRKSF